MDIFDRIAEIEKEIFSDAWSIDLIRDSFGYDYNHFLAVTEDGRLICDRDTLINDQILCERQNFDDKNKIENTDKNVVDDNASTAPVDTQPFIAGYLLFSALDVFELQRIAVRENYRRRGLADKLMERFTDAGFRNGISQDSDGRIILEVRAKNAPAIGLYKKYGFVEISVRKNYYTDPVEDALIMQWNDN